MTSQQNIMTFQFLGFFCSFQQSFSQRFVSSTVVNKGDLLLAYFDPKYILKPKLAFLNFMLMHFLVRIKVELPTLVRMLQFAETLILSFFTHENIGNS